MVAGALVSILPNSCAEFTFLHAYDGLEGLDDVVELLLVLVHRKINGLSDVRLLFGVHMLECETKSTGFGGLMEMAGLTSMSAL